MRIKQTILFLFLLFMSLSLFSQTKFTVTGVVSDEYGDALLGVSVIIKDTKNGTMTNMNGEYSIEIEDGKTLVFRYIGCISQEIIVKNKKNNVINITLKEDSKNLEEVVVVGYAPQRKETITGSVQTISSALQGRVAGVMLRGAPSTSSAYYNDQSNEEYKSFADNAFKSVSKEPLSTFSIDVDNASYSNMRRIINQGRVPNMDAIRTEELINYFDYDYAIPTGDDPVKVSAEIGECPWNKKHRLVKLGLKAKEIPVDKLPASNLVFLIDVSGSMSGATRIDLVKSSMKLLINNLREDDRVSVVTYANGVEVKLEPTSGKEKAKIAGVIDALEASGGTSGGAALQLAYKQAKANFEKQKNNRIILCTDGDFNIGVSSSEGLEELIKKERESGVFLSILGYGMGNYKDSKMQALAQAGNGNHAYIDNIQEANKVLVKEFGSTLHTIGKDVKLQLEFNPTKVQAYRLIGYETRLLNNEDFNDDKKDAGEMGMGHTVTALYEIVPAGIDSNVFNIDPLKYQKQYEKDQVKKPKNDYPDLFTVKMRYKDPDNSTSKKLEQAVIDDGKNNVSSDFNFAVSVAMFSQLLRNSEYKGDTTYDDVLSLAKSSLGKDKDGYRSEFVRLVDVVKGLGAK